MEATHKTGIVPWNGRPSRGIGRDFVAGVQSRWTNLRTQVGKSCYVYDMESDLNIDVATLDAPHRRALEEVIGRQLGGNQRLVISVVDVVVPASAASRPAQTLDDWTNVYEGLSDAEIESVDQIARTRADLTRQFP